MSANPDVTICYILARILHEGNGFSGKSAEEDWTNITNALASQGLSGFVQDSKADFSENRSGPNCILRNCYLSRRD